MLKTFCHLHDEEGIFRFYVGGALGVDMWAAEQLLYLKEQPGYQDIELIVALPFEGHDSKSCGAFGFPSSEILDIWCFLDYAVSSRLDSIYAFSTLCAE